MLITDALTVFRQGKELANAATWKNRTIATNTLGAFLGAVLAVAAAFGYRIEIDAETTQALAGGIAAAVAVFNAVMHVITSAKVGLPAKPETDWPARFPSLTLDAGLDEHVPRGGD